MISSQGPGLGGGVPSQTQCKRNVEVLIGQFWADVGATTPGPEELASLEPSCRDAKVHKMPQSDIQTAIALIWPLAHKPPNPGLFPKALHVVLGIVLGVLHVVGLVFESHAWQ